MRHKEEMIKRRDKYLEMSQDRGNKITHENNELCKAIAIKEAEALSLIEVIEDSERVECDNKTLHQKMLKLEGEITNNASNCKQLNTEINEKTGEVKE